MKYEVTAEVKATVVAETAHGAMEFVKQKYGADNVESVTAVEKDEFKEKREHFENAIKDMVYGLKQLEKDGTVVFNVMNLKKVTFNILPADFVKMYKSFTIAPKEESGETHCCSVNLGFATVESFLTDKEIDEVF